MKFRHTDHREEIKLQMTPMIDIVFQLLVFFIMSFRIVLPEGDFNIRMPLPAENAQPSFSETPTLKLTMTADASGNLTAMRIGAQAFEGEQRFLQLHSYIRGMVGDSGGPGTGSEQEVEIDTDYDLRYDYVIRAITALTGYLDETGQRHRLIEKIRLSPPEEN